MFFICGRFSIFESKLGLKTVDFEQNRGQSEGWRPSLLGERELVPAKGPMPAELYLMCFGFSPAACARRGLEGTKPQPAALGHSQTLCRCFGTSLCKCGTEIRPVAKKMHMLKKAKHLLVPCSQVSKINQFVEDIAICYSCSDARVTMCCPSVTSGVKNY